MGPNKKLGRAAIVRWLGALRYGLLLVVLAAGGGVGLIVGASAFGDTVCGTTGDMSDCAQWGVDGYATRLAVQNTGTQTISSFTFTLPAGAMVSGVAGTTSCSWTSSQVTCTAPIAPGQTFFADILYMSGTTPAVGSTGTLTPSDANGVAQPGQSVSLQQSTVCGTNPCTLSSSTATSTSTETSTTPPCQATLDVTKSLEGREDLINRRPDLYITFKDAAPLHYKILVRNVSQCAASTVVVTDALPNDFDCTGGDWEFTVRGLATHHFHCKGTGQVARIDVGEIEPGLSVEIKLSGRFLRERASTNIARAVAANAPGAHSQHIHVDVVSKQQFHADVLKVK